MESASARQQGWSLSGAVIVLSTAVVAVLLGGSIVVYSGRGFDFTDEGYYLNLIAHPSDYRSTPTAGLFQYVWHPIFEMTGGNIALVRVANVAVSVTVTFALAWTLTSDRSSAAFEIEFWLVIPASILIVVALTAGRIRRTVSGSGLALLPVVTTFGTNNKSWRAWSRVAAFWVLAAIVLTVSLGASRQNSLTPLFAIVVVFSVVTIGLSIVFPYRQGSRLTADTLTKVGTKDLRLTADYSQRIEQAQAVLGGGDTLRGVVDLTGESPGLILAAGQRALGQAWILGAYAGSEDLARTALSDARCSDLRHAAVLVAPQGDRRIDTHVLSNVGLDLERDFTLRGTVGSDDGSIQVVVPRTTIGALNGCRS